MFLRFSKGSYNKLHGFMHTIRKCVLLGDSLVMEYGNNIVGVAKLNNETDKILDYDIVVAAKCQLGAETITRYIKNMIGKSNKFTEHPSAKRRKYYVEEIDAEVLPIRAQITFSFQE